MLAEVACLIIFCLISGRLNSEDESCFCVSVYPSCEPRFVPSRKVWFGQKILTFLNRHHWILRRSPVFGGSAPLPSVDMGVS